MKKSSILILALSFLGISAQAASLPPLRTVPYVELNRYLGTWYEIARFPNSFQKKCSQATAEYSLRDDNSIEVVNTCVRNKDRTTNQVHGRAQVVDTETFAKLKVSFLPAWLRWTGIGVGKYWIIDLDDEYTYAVVSEPSRKYLWILSRTPVMSRSVYDGIMSRMVEQYLDPARLIPSREGNVEEN